MDKIDWKRKLTSRKLWAAIASFVSMMIVAFGGAESQATQITALIMAGATLLAKVWLTLLMLVLWTVLRSSKMPMLLTSLLSNATRQVLPGGYA